MLQHIEVSKASNPSHFTAWRFSEISSPVSSILGCFNSGNYRMLFASRATSGIELPVIDIVRGGRTGRWRRNSGCCVVHLKHHRTANISDERKSVVSQWLLDVVRHSCVYCDRIRKLAAVVLPGSQAAEEEHWTRFASESAGRRTSGTGRSRIDTERMVHADDF